jgi:hypothetical protein
MRVNRFVKIAFSKGFECRYAAAFQILGKNSFTPEVESSVKYDSVQVCAVPY